MKALVLSQQSQITSQENLLKLQTGQIELLEEKLRLHLLKRFGKSTEKYTNTGEVTLFDDAEYTGSLPEEAEEETEVPAHKRKKRRGKRAPLPDFLPRICKNYELSERDQVCPSGGGKLNRIGESTSEQLDIIPAKVQVIQHIRGKYAC